MKELRQALAGHAHGNAVGVEGPNLVHEAVRAGLRIHTVFVAGQNDAAAQERTLPAETEILLLPEDVLRSALVTETPQAVAALLDPPAWTWNHVLGSDPNRVPLIVVLAGLQDPGNLGTILRSAEAFGATGIVSLPGTVSVWNSKAVRASAGSVFRVPLVAAKAADAIARLRAAGVQVLTTSAGDGLSADRARLSHPVALLIGNEGNGVPEQMAELADGALRIPCTGPVESLNAAVAASVLLYEASRQRASEPAGPAARRRGAR